MFLSSVTLGMEDCKYCGPDGSFLRHWRMDEVYPFPTYCEHRVLSVVPGDMQRKS